MTSAELKLLQGLLGCSLQLPCRLFENNGALYDYASELYSEVFTSDTLRTIPIEQITGSLQPQTIYGIQDRFLLYVILIRLPKQSGILMLGPCLIESPDEKMLLHVLKKNALPTQAKNALHTFYQKFSVLNIATLHTIGRMIGQYLYQDLPLDHRTFRAWDRELAQPIYTDDAAVLMETGALAQRYELESQLMKAVEQGNRTRAFDILLQNPIAAEPGATESDTLQSAKIASLAFLAKVDAAAGRGGVGPFHREKGYRLFVSSITRAKNVAEISSLYQAILRHYLYLVRRQTAPQCSKSIQQVVDMIHLNLSEPLSVARIAAEFKVNPDYLSHTFKVQMGLSLTEYINKQRIITAVQYLDETDLPIRDIALYVGYEDINYFSRMFKRYVNRSPREYRKIVRGQIQANIQQQYALFPRPGGRLENIQDR